ncbi:tRNA (N(6)-L-threonylcarbamoyladenosine(37)-C(2))-methylthiotransferase MtaB [Roseospirillum parvum]|uniref:tRNA (N(6)-L-threonylcarbamoyladenosine(37)-C(2))-methylthiotransferase n=1 Tax=Roseospirillum parvum TaxID=83401 RepID=A0A1G7WHF0_9PROT|nr:tRNA (N(6)-L-threonylcarbamoyladenosine(37)-C(2))-methylthiotransferase MtaB [Roseospirillum parvum]SDG71391.1 threonylcarbamoyladenosine tRNA methylthiotransferase MtaB [Roseospirillum parvum]
MTHSKPRPDVVTFGCRTNAFESEIIRDHLAKAPPGSRPRVVVNTCAVTAEAERQARQTIRRLRREHPEAEIVVTGCAAQLAPERWAELPGVARVLGNPDKLQADSWDPTTEAAAAAGPSIQVSDPEAVAALAPHLVAGFEDRARGFVQIQQGCDHRCTFCVIPLARGPNRSVAVERVIEQARALVAGGLHELVLTGVDLTSWGGELPGAPRLGALVAALLEAVPELPRLRLSSLDPAALDEQLLDLLAGHPRVMPHVHFSVQAGDDMILKRMKRRHDRARVIELCEHLGAARPEIVFGADLIAGFPTETEAMFANTRALIDQAGLAHLHVFPYSPRPGTPAARMRRLPGEVVKARAAELRAAGAARLEAVMQARLGQTAELVLEADGQARDPSFLPVRVDRAVSGLVPGRLIRVRFAAIDNGSLQAEVIG